MEPRGRCLQVVQSEDARPDPYNHINMSNEHIVLQHAITIFHSNGAKDTAIPRTSATVEYFERWTSNDYQKRN